MGNLFSKSIVIELNEINSTNTYISELKNPLPEGSIVIAKSQTQGRGQGNNSWESNPGENLTFSIVLTPKDIHASLQFYISKIVSLAVADFILLHTDRVSIKWPNDIYVADKKIAGILIENSIEGIYIKQSIAGIGININQAKFCSNAPNPVSLAQLTKKQYPLKSLLTILQNLIETRYAQLTDRNFSGIDADYLQKLYRLNQKSSFSADGKIFEGTIIRVEPTGELVIADTGKKIHKFWHKEVEFIL